MATKYRQVPSRLGRLLSSLGVLAFALAYGHAVILRGTATLPRMHLGVAIIGLAVWGTAERHWDTGAPPMSLLAIAILFISHILLLLEPIANGYRPIALALVGTIAVMVGGYYLLRVIRGRNSTPSTDSSS